MMQRWTSHTLKANEKAVDNFMTKSWITREMFVKPHQRPSISCLNPQNYPQVIFNKFNVLGIPVHGVHVYNSIKQQH
jgi:hypothetical protein